MISSVTDREEVKESKRYIIYSYYEIRMKSKKGSGARVGKVSREFDKLPQ